MKVKDIMSTPVYVVSPDEPISRARNLMLKHKISRLVVMEDNLVAGIVTKTDIQRRLKQVGPDWRRRPIDEVPISLVMTESVIDIYHDAEIKQAVELMIDNSIT
ncbi:MAG: CBS domain-containing protein, partial [Methanosarcinales archaeon]|nr:CBS domain-containing protein [Methanosarcinales archaeon]